MLAGQIAGLPSAWNCKHSGDGSLGHSRKLLASGILGRGSGVFAFSLWDSRANSVSVITALSPVGIMRRNAGHQMLNTPLQMENWTVAIQ